MESALSPLIIPPPSSRRKKKIVTNLKKEPPFAVYIPTSLFLPPAICAKPTVPETESLRLRLHELKSEAELRGSRTYLLWEVEMEGSGESFLW